MMIKNDTYQMNAPAAKAGGGGWQSPVGVGVCLRSIAGGFDHRSDGLRAGFYPPPLTYL